MITDEVKKAEIIRTMSIEKCEICIENILITMEGNIDNTQWDMNQSIRTIRYYIDCMRIMREYSRRIEVEAEIDPMEKHKYICY